MSGDLHGPPVDFHAEPVEDLLPFRPRFGPVVLEGVLDVDGAGDGGHYVEISATRSRNVTHVFVFFQIPIGLIEMIGLRNGVTHGSFESCKCKERFGARATRKCRSVPEISRFEIAKRRWAPFWRVTSPEVL